MRIYHFTWQDEFKLNSTNTVKARRSLIMAAFFAMISLLVWASILSGDGSSLGIIGLVIGVGFLVLSIWLISSRVDVSMKNGIIHVRRRTLFGVQTFEDPIDAYRGVIHTTTLYKKLAIRWAHGGVYPSIEDNYVQRIELVHPQRKGVVPLFQSVTQQIPRSDWEDYAKRFNIPMLIMDGKRLIERSPEDTDKSIKELAEEGKLDRPTDIGRPPWPFKMVSTDDLIRIVIRLPAVGWWWLALALIAPVTILIAVLSPNASISLTRTFLVLIILFAPAIYLALIRRHVLVYRDRIEWVLKFPFFKSRVSDSLLLNEIEQVSLRKVIGDRKSSLLLSSDHHSLTVARGVRPKYLEWLRDFIISAIVSA